MKFNKQIYVRIEKDGNDSYMLANTELDGEHGDKVAVYRLVGIKKLFVAPRLVRLV